MAPMPENNDGPRPDAQTDGFARAAIILGMLSFFCLCFLPGIPAIILGHVARGRIARSSGTLRGSGMALAGSLLGYFSLLLVFGLAALVLPAAQMEFADASVRGAHYHVNSSLTQYQATNGKLPTMAPLAMDEQVDLVTLMGQLGLASPNNNDFNFSGNNGRWLFHSKGVLCDSWFRPLNVAIDLNGDGNVSVGTFSIPGQGVVWSSGKNGVNEHGLGDDVVTW